jgi:hypothetical protein
LAPDTTLIVNIPSRLASTIEPDESAEWISSALMRDGFYERRHTGIGWSIGPDDIRRLPLATHTSSLMRGARGFDVRCYRLSACQVFTRRGCDPIVFVDGGQRLVPLDSAVEVTEVFALEAYESWVDVPNRFPPSDCAIAVWTKNFAGLPLRSR